MQKIEIEAMVGETIQLGRCLLTIVDVQDGEAVICIENPEMEVEEELTVLPRKRELPPSH